MGSAASRAAGRLTRLVKDPRMVGIGLASGTVAATGADTCRTITGGADDDPVVPLELYCEIAKFYSVVDDTFHNMLRAAGPRNAAYFRRYYLAGNNHYLFHSLRGGRDKRDRQWRRSKIRPWLTANPEWRQLVRPHLIEAFRGETTATASVLYFFNNPAYAVIFGLQDVLEHQIETMVSYGIDVNGFWGPSFGTLGTSKHHLLAHCLSFDNYPAFDYLLGVNQVDVREPSDSDDDSSLTIFGYALAVHSCADRGAYIQALVEHPSIDVNAVCFRYPGKMITNRPLHSVFFLLKRTKYKSAAYHRLLRVIRILVRAGADPNLDTEDIGSPNGLLQCLASKSITSRMKFRAVRKILRGI
eukprot:CAMPEP_0178534826 /NCGR_PEP_ID=MMETSP0696-20121128/35231_1 /TAXON_ID=265572 /ORGANISM="Extubocellulus spinifer, Strain CCMP396" /LENGTH=356 /DNA_ID=CAMNT_0020166949 /DNA_START=268 /DNA_END=1338 /DNA_ORIENTATION=+